MSFIFGVQNPLCRYAASPFIKIFSGIRTPSAASRHLPQGGRNILIILEIFSPPTGGSAQKEKGVLAYPEWLELPN